jgi:hypothetical protein
LYIFSESNALRRLLFHLVGHSITELVVFSAIIINCILLAMDNPSVVAGSTLRAGLDAADIVFATFFAVEMVVKLIAWGGWGCGDTYVAAVMIIAQP